MTTRNKVTQVYEIVGANKVAAKNRRIEMSIRALSRASRRLNLGMMATGRLFGSTTLGLVTIGYALRRTIRSYSDYTDAIANMRTVLAGQGVQVRAHVRLTSALAETTSRELGYSVTEATNAMTTLIQAGLGTHRSMRVYRVGMQLARVANLDASRTNQFLVDSMNMFQNEMTDTGEELQHFARRMATQLSVAANAASTNIGDLQNAFRYAGGELSGLGYTSREVISALAALSAGGIRSTTAGTRLRGAIAALNNPSQRTVQIFKEIAGVTEDELRNTFYNIETGEMRSLTEGIQRMGELFRRIETPMRRNQALMRLYGRRALIAGMTLSDMGEMASRFHHIQERISRQDVTDGTILDEQEAERMRSFSMQITQLKNAVEELAIGFGEILFGSLEEGNKGFGTYVRNITAAMRLSGNLSDMTPDQRRQWESLSEEERNAGRELREFLVIASDALKIIGKGIIYVARFTREHPRLVIALIALRLALSPTSLSIIQFAMSWRRARIAAIAASPGITSAAGAVGRANQALIGLRFLAGAAAIHGIGMLTSRLQENLLVAIDARHEYQQITRDVDGFASGIENSIPIVGNLIAQYIRLGSVIKEAINQAIELDTRRYMSQQQELRSANEIMESRYSLAVVRGSIYGRSTEGMSEGQIRQRIAIREQQEAVQRMSTIFYAMSRLGTNVDREMVQNRLSEVRGMNPERLNRMTNTIMHNLQNNTDVLRGDMERLNIESGTAHTLLPTVTEQLGTFTREIDRLGNVIEGESFGFDAPQSYPSSNMSIPTAGDAYVRRTGVMGVSAGDIVVSREHLAQAMMGSRGSLVPSIMNNGNIVSPSGRSGTGETVSTVDVPVILQIDGHEIARANGRAHIRHLERSGTTIQPGQRRTLAESGFSESMR